MRPVYLKTFLALLGLLALTVAIAYLHLGIWSVAAAMAIALLKATLIVMYFMHVRYEVGLVRVFSVAGFVWLTVLFVFLMADYATRVRLLTGQ
jgi:cytochrome c oxidase subunit 4